jgi:hypothetical protein
MRPVRSAGSRGCAAPDRLESHAQPANPELRLKFHTPHDLCLSMSSAGRATKTVAPARPGLSFTLCVSAVNARFVPSRRKLGSFFEFGLLKK